MLSSSRDLARSVVSWGKPEITIVEVTVEPVSEPVGADQAAVVGISRGVHLNKLKVHLVPELCEANGLHHRVRAPAAAVEWIRTRLG